MKSLYWRPQKISRRALLGIGLLSIVGFMVVEFCPWTTRDPHADAKWSAARKSQEMMRVLKEERGRRGIPFQPEFDPTESGMLGSSMTSMTTRPADLQSKQTSVNPNFAAVVVDMLTRAGVQRGDTVAVGWSGSFPAFNVSVAAALEAMELRPIIIASATSSQYGANDPDFLWLDMESALRARGMLPFGSSAVTIGGGADRGLGMSPEALELINDAIARNQIPLLPSARRAQSIENRMKHYQQLAQGQPIKAYINVGGGVASTGGQHGKYLFRPGLNRRVSRRALQIDSVMARFAKDGVPLIHMIEARDLADRYAMPVAPTEAPKLGVSRAFSNHLHNRWLAAAVLLVILITLRSYMLTPWAHRIAKWVSLLRPAEQKPRLRVVNEVANESPLAEPQLMV